MSLSPSTRHPQALQGSLTSHLAQNVGFTAKRLHWWDSEPHTSSISAIHHPAPKLFVSTTAGCLMGTWTWASRNGVAVSGYYLLTMVQGRWHRQGRGPQDSHRLTSACRHNLTHTNHSPLPDHALHFQAPCLCPHWSLPGLPSSSFIPEWNPVIFKAQVKCHSSGMPPQTADWIAPSSVPNIISLSQWQLLLCLSHGCTGDSFRAGTLSCCSAIMKQV